MLQLRRIVCRIEDTGHSWGCCVPDGFYDDEIIVKRVNKFGRINLDSFRTASKKDYEMVDGMKKLRADYYSWGY